MGMCVYVFLRLHFHIILSLVHVIMGEREESEVRGAWVEGGGGEESEVSGAGVGGGEESEVRGGGGEGSACCGQSQGGIRLKDGLGGMMVIPGLIIKAAGL